MIAKTPQTNENQAGFTLLEILIVVSIIGALAVFVLPTLIGAGEDAKAQLAKMQIQKVEGTLDFYRAQNGIYPSSEQGLVALVREPTGEPAPRNYKPGGYMKSDQLRDPWGSEFIYESPGQNNRFGVDICSLGPDGQRGNDDICNFDATQ